MTAVLPELAFLMDETSDVDQGAILDAALSAFLDFGIRRTSMGEIAKRSGLSPATLYRRFNGKDEIVWAVGRREARRLIADVDAGVDPASSAEDQAVSMLVGFLAGFRGNQLLHRLLATEPEMVLPLLTTQAGPVLAIGRTYLAAFIRRLEQQLDLPPADVDPMAEMVARVALSMALTPETCIPLDDADGIRRFARQCLAGVLGASGVAAPRG